MPDNVNLRIQVIAQHKEWANKYGGLWVVITLATFLATFVLVDEEAVRTPSLVLLGAILVVGAIWQAAGMAVARVHMLMIEAGQLGMPTPRSGTDR